RAANSFGVRGRVVPPTKPAGYRTAAWPRQGIEVRGAWFQRDFSYTAWLVMSAAGYLATACPLGLPRSGLGEHCVPALGHGAGVQAVRGVGKGHFVRLG